MSNERGKGTIIKTFCWPLGKLDILRKVEKLSAHRGLSGLIQELLTEYVMKEQAIMENNPIGLRYNSSNSDTNSRFWIDSMLEPDEQKAREDIQLIEDSELVSRISVRSKKINDAANARALELYRIKKPRIASGNYTIVRGVS